MKTMGGLWLVLLMGCMQNDPASVFVLGGVLAIDANTCQPEIPNGADTVFQTYGRYDPQTGEHYLLPLFLRNNMRSREESPVLLQSGENIARRARDVLLTNVEVCWFEEKKQIKINDEGVYYSCDSLPAEQHAFIPVSGLVPEGSGVAAVPVKVLNLQALQALWGGLFQPSFLPAQGLISEESGLFSLGVKPPTETPRDIHWGGFPASDQVRVVLQVRVWGALSGGDRVVSNWISFPIEICVGCAAAACGQLQRILCPADVCTDVNEANEEVKTLCVVPGATVPVCSSILSPSDPGCQAACASFDPCLPQRYGLKGQTRSASDTCLPAQFVKNPTCEPLKSCTSLTE
jgi:hypothetical protein